MQYATHYEEGKKVSFKKFDLNLAGLLFLPEEPDALKDAILRAADWTEETYTGTQSHIRQLVEEKYNWKHSAECLAEGYRNAWQRKQR